MLFSNWSEKHFPANKPAALPPSPGYKTIGYMGCSASKVEAVRKRQRLLFFADTIDTPQKYALSRTSWRSRLKGTDEPVVLQLEIREETHIGEKDLWRDPQLSKSAIYPNPHQPQFVSFWAAIPPDVQERCDLQVRVHHVVTCALQQSRGGCCRAAEGLWQKVTDLVPVDGLSTVQSHS